MRKRSLYHTERAPDKASASLRFPGNCFPGNSYPGNCYRRRGVVVLGTRCVFRRGCARIGASMDYIPRQILERALRRLGRRALADRLHAMRALADVRGVRYLDDRGRARTIAVALKPWILTSDQLFCFHWVAQLLSDALLRLAHLHARVPAVRRVVRFEPERERWMRMSAHPRSRPLAVIGRLDSTATYDHAGWRTAFRMLEPNAVGVGGVQYAPTGCSITLDVLGDVLAEALPGRAITATPDPRQLLMDELGAVAK